MIVAQQRKAVRLKSTMPSVSSNVKHQLGSVIKKFKFEELESAVFPTFPELTWNKVKSKLIKEHESLTTPHALRFIEEGIEKAKISEKTLKSRLATLEVIDTSRHFKRKIWYCYEFKGKDAPTSFTLREIEEHIKQSFNVYHMEVETHAVMHKGITFVSIKDKPKKKPMRGILPTYFSLVPNEHFFFCSKKVVLKNALMALVDGLGYRSCKQIKLMGRDIPSLVQMLLARKIAALQSDLVKAPLPFKPAPPVSTPLGLDFTQHKQRKEYAEKCFGEKPPTFEILKVKSLDQTWKHEEASEKLPNEVIFTGVEFRSQSIPNFLKKLVEQKVLMTPLPCYAANILSLGRNDLTVKENR